MGGTVPAKIPETSASAVHPGRRGVLVNVLLISSQLTCLDASPLPAAPTLKAGMETGPRAREGPPGPVKENWAWAGCRQRVGSWALRAAQVWPQGSFHAGPRPSEARASACWNFARSRKHGRGCRTQLGPPAHTPPDSCPHFLSPELFLHGPSAQHPPSPWGCAVFASKAPHIREPRGVGSWTGGLQWAG